MRRPRADSRSRTCCAHTSRPISRTTAAPRTCRVGKRSAAGAIPDRCARRASRPHEQPLDHARPARASKLGRASHSSGSMPASRSQSSGRYKPAVSRILADVARDIRQLHGDAEIAGAGEQRGIAHAHHHRHHGADRAGHAHRVVLELRQVLVAATFRIPFEALEQRLGKRLGNAQSAPPHRRMRDPRRSSRGVARVDPVEARMQTRRAPSARSPPRSMASSAIRQKAYSAGGRLAHAGRAAPTTPQRSFAIRRASIARHAATSALRRVRLSEGMNAHRAPLYQERARKKARPATPAPGWVPAPTRYKPSTSSLRLCGRNQALCVSDGAKPNAAPRYDNKPVAKIQRRHDARTDRHAPRDPGSMVAAQVPGDGPPIRLRPCAAQSMPLPRCGTGDST